KSNGNYYPKELKNDEINFKSKGTLIKISNFKKGIERTEASLRKKLARRFSAIEKGNNFEISVNNKIIDISDREYFNKLQYIWYFGNSSKHYLTAINNSSVKSEQRANNVTSNHKVTG